MSTLPDLFHSLRSVVLKIPGDKIFACITKTGKEVVKFDTSEVKCSAVRYPSTGTIVETKVYRE